MTYFKSNILNSTDLYKINHDYYMRCHLHNLNYGLRKEDFPKAAESIAKSRILQREILRTGIYIDGNIKIDFNNIGVKEENS